MNYAGALCLAILLLLPVAGFAENQPAGLSPLSSIALTNRTYVNECSSRLPLGTTSFRSHVSYEPCRGLAFFSRPLRSFTRYGLVRDELGIHIQTRLRFGFGRAFRNQPFPSPERQEQMFSFIRGKCLTQMKEVWARYGIFFDLEVDTLSAPLPGPADHFMTVYDGPAPGSEIGMRGNRSNLYYGPPNIYTSAEAGENLFCKQLLHETGHMIGLQDEYLDPQCPARPFVRTYPKDGSMPNGIMDNQSGPWERLEFYPEHVRAVLAPICEN